MRMALATLLDGACYHMSDVFRGSRRDWDHWDQALEDIGKEEKTNQVKYRQCTQNDVTHSFLQVNIT